MSTIEWARKKRRITGKELERAKKNGDAETIAKLETVRSHWNVIIRSLLKDEQKETSCREK